MGFAALSDIRVIIAFWIGAVSTLVAAVMLLEVLRMRSMLMLRERRSRQFKKNARHWLIRYIAGEELELPKIARRDLPDFLYLWIQFQEVIYGDSKLILNQAFLRLGIVSRVRKLLRSGSFEEQVIAATALGHLGDKQSWEYLRVLLKKASPLLSITAARALVMIDPDRACDIVIPLIIQHRDWMPARLALMLKQADPSFQQAFLAQLEREAEQLPPYLLRLLRLLDTVPTNRPLSFVEKFLTSSDDDDLVAACLRLVRHPSELELVRGRFNDSRWSVQVQIAAVLAGMGSPEDAHYLLSLLDSEHWWVRYRAAQSLLALPFINRRAVKRLIESRSDVYARDMLQQILAEQVRR